MRGRFRAVYETFDRGRACGRDKIGAIVPTMVPNRKWTVFFIFAYLCCTSMFAQDKDARNRLLIARAQYYTPTTGGLTSFKCEASVDWKGLFARLRQTETTEDDPALKYLEGVNLSVLDQLKGNGSLEWTETSALPEGQEARVKQIHDGFETMIVGFFQSWNAYMNGTMVPFPDDTVTVTTEGDGLHLHAAATGMQVDEDYDENAVLTQAVVATTAAKIVAIPTFVRTPDGLLVSAVASRINQPPSAPQMEVSFQVEYASVDSFRLPSHILYDVKNVAQIEIRLQKCRASVADFAPKSTN